MRNSLHFSHLLGKPVWPGAFVAQLLCTNFPCNNNRFQAERTFCSALLLYQHHLCIPSCPTLSTDSPLHFPQCSYWFMYWIGSSFTTFISCRYLSLPQLRLYFPSDSLHLFLQRLSDSTANILESSFPNTQCIFIPNHQWYTWKSPDSGSLAAVPDLRKKWSCTIHFL